MSQARANRVELSPLIFLDRAHQAFGDRLGMIHGEQRVTYRQLTDRAHRLAAVLRKLDVRAGDRVAYLAHNGPALLEAHFGVALAGAVLVAMNTRLAPSEFAYILDHSEARALFVDAELAPLVSPVLADCPSVKQVVTIVEDGSPAGPIESEYEQMLAAVEPDFASGLPASEDDPISINYTSGTTGKPKGVVYTHRGAYLNALNVALELQLSPASVYLWTLPMFHCNGWCCPWAVTAAGSTHIGLRKFAPQTAWQLMRDHRVTHFCGAPTILISLASEPSALPVTWPVRAVTGGAPPSPTTIAQMSRLGVEVVHLYGMTETYGPSLSCSWWPEWNSLASEDQASKKARQGVPHSGIGQVIIADHDGQPLAADGKSMGELLVRGNTIMAGYFKDEAATKEAFRDGWLHTGDLGVMHDDGYVELRDRAKDIVISGGENISTIEIEQVLMRHPAVLETAVVGVPDERWGEVPKAFVNLQPGASVSTQELIDFTKRHLARFKAPKMVEFGELPKTSTGKIQKFVLREREWAGRDKRIH